MASMTKDEKKAYKSRKVASKNWIKNFDKTIDEATKAAKEEEAAWIREGIVQEDDEE